MPRNGSGSYSLPQPPFAAGTVISSTAMNSDMNDIASALTGSLPRDGQAGMSGQFKATDGSTLSPSIAFSNETSSGFSRASAGVLAVDILGVQVGTFAAGGWTGNVQGVTPVGTVVDFAGSTAPTGWYFCAGGTLNRTTQSNLFAVIGTTYGAGDGLTTYTLPDLRGRTTFGKDNMGGVAAGRLTTTYYASDPTVLGNTGGAQNHTMTTAEMVSHQHNVFLHDLGHFHAYNQFSQLALANAGSGAGIGTNIVANTSTNTTGLTVGSVNGVANDNKTALAGTTTPSTIVNPGIILNKIIFAGQ